MNITVAICTWNRSSLLDQTLTEMHKLRIPAGVEWELLIANNNCTDNTDDVIGRHSSRLPIRRLFEEQPGLSNARNCVIAACRGETIIWTDDDVLVDPHWLTEYVRATQAWPSASYFGGTVAPWFGVRPPRWIEQNMDLVQSTFAIANDIQEERWLEPAEVPVGANMAFRVNALREEKFDTALGHVAGSVGGGEELDMIERFVRSGHRGVWIPSATVRHWIDPTRLTQKYIWNWNVGASRAAFRNPDFADVATVFGIPRWAIRQYLTCRLKSIVLRPTLNRDWLTAMILAAKARGVMLGARSPLSIDRST